MAKAPPIENSVIANPWQQLRQFTAARIALGRAGAGLPTERLLEFQLAHAQAQDAVHQPLDTATLAAELNASCGLAATQLHSKAPTRAAYLQRPDWGRRLDDPSRQRLQTLSGDLAANFDLAITLVDGLSSRAVQANAVPLLKALAQTLAEDAQSWQLAPVTIVEQGRVAIGDEVGELLNARAVIVLIGERPGLSSPDSLGIYYTWAPKVGLTDASRNCISNVRLAGLKFEDAVTRLMYLLTESRAKNYSGVNLKDRTNSDVIEHQGGAKNFLLPE